MTAVKKAIISDAGFASRYLPITKTIPKAMIPFGAKPVMQLCVEECAAAGIEEVIIVATPNTIAHQIYDDYFHGEAKQIEKLLASQGKQGRFEPVKEVLALPKITVIEQDPSLPYGNGSPFLSAKGYVENDEAFIAMFSDDLVLGKGDVATLIECFSAHPEAKAIIAAQEMPEKVWCKYGMIALKGDGVLSHIVEKPKTPDLSPSNLTSYGRYLLTPEIFEYLTPDGTGLDNELWMTDAITKLAGASEVRVAKSNGRWVTTGDPKNYFLAHLEYALENAGYADDIKNIVDEWYNNKEIKK